LQMGPSRFIGIDGGDLVRGKLLRFPTLPMF